MSSEELPDELVENLRDRWVLARQYRHESLPLIMHEELYEYFGEWCKITDANIYDTVENAMVVIENRSGTRTEVEFSELRWRTNYALADASCKKPQIKVITEGP